jgi:hypothetical protein
MCLEEILLIEMRDERIPKRNEKEVTITKEMKECDNYKRNERM